MPAITHKRKLTIPLLAAFVLAVNFITMPADFYAGDSYAIKAEAIHLVRTGEFGFKKAEARDLGVLLDVTDQYFKLNTATGRYHNRWGLFNLLISSIPELVNMTRNEHFLRNGTLDIDEPSLFAHNIFNCLLSALLAVFLYRTAALFSRFNVLRLTLVVSTLYASFAWNYMRAQSYEILHLLLFTAFFYYYVVFLRCFDSRRRFTSYPSFILYNLCLAALCLSKSFYFIIYPLLFFPICARLTSINGGGLYRTVVRHGNNLLLVITAGVLTMLTYLIFSYFFYGQVFFGYLSAHPDSSRLAFSYRFIPARLHDYFVSENRSLFVHMPLLILGLAGFPWYLKRHRYEAWFLLVLFLFAVGFFSCCYTVGESCYGPRFFLFLLPVLCLPAVYPFELFIRQRRFAIVAALGTAVLVISAVSLRAQLEVNTWDFHLRYELQDQLQKGIGVPPAVADYFAHANFAVIARDTSRLIAGDPDNFLDQAYAQYYPGNNKGALYRKLSKYVSARFRRNYYFNL